MNTPFSLLFSNTTPSPSTLDKSDMPAAIVVGATGILGREIVHELSKHRQQWPTIHALSRSKKEDFAETVIHHHVDLQSSPDEMAQDLKSVQGNVVFFAGYIQKDTEQENWHVNGAILSNFLQALVKTGAVSGVDRIVLVTGAKQYGVHLGAVKNPMLESDPWLTDSKWPPNFYYNQQNILHYFCKEHHKEWTVTYPNDVIGYAVGNYMNLATAIALYAIISKELDAKDEGLVFPGSPSFYTKFDCFTNSKLHGQFCTWAATDPRAANEAFNVHNGDAESWQNLWPKVANYFGTKVKSNQFATTTGSSVLKYVTGDASSTAKLAPEPPLSERAEELGLQGHPALEQSVVEQHIDLEKWSRRSDVKQAWEQIAEKYDLQKDAFEKATWDFLGFVLGRKYDLVISMSKARKAGWTGYVDTWESLEGTFEELRAAKILPQA
jgi:nucleoside-diphosphate-sugar epimerase